MLKNEGRISVPWCWMEIDIPQHVLFNEESKVTWSYQKGKYYQQVDSPSTYTQDPSVICTQKGLKIWYKPERKHQIRSRGKSLSFTFAKQSIQFGRDPVKILPPSNQGTKVVDLGKKSQRIGRSFLCSSVAITSPPPQVGTCGTSSSSSVGNDRKEGIWNLMANLKAAPRSLTTTPSSEACLWLIDWLIDWLIGCLVGLCKIDLEQANLFTHTCRDIYNMYLCIYIIYV